MARILLVEDYPALQTIYTEVLTAEGHEVELANDGSEGLAAAKASTYDIVLLDLLTPNKSGLEFLEAFDAKHKPETSVVVISNIYSPELLNQALERGASQYLLKSDITPQQLIKIVRETLDKPKQTEK